MKKKFVLVLILLIVYLCVSFYIIFVNNNNVVYLGSSTQVIVKKNGIKIVEKNENIYVKKAKIYFNNKFIDGYLKSINEKGSKEYYYQAINKNKQALSFSNDLVAYTGNLNIKIASFNTYKIINNSEKEKLKAIDQKEDIKGDIKDVEKIEFDIDNDSDLEKIYSYSVIDNDILTTVVVLVDGSNDILLDVKRGNSLYPGIKKIYFSNLIDFNNDDLYEIVLYQSNGDDSIGKYKIFKYENNSISKIK